MGKLDDAAQECSNRHDMSVAERVRELREALGLTQQDVADRSGGRLNQGTLAKVEGGLNKGTGASTRGGLASAFGVTLDSLEAYLAGTLGLDVLLARRAAPSDTAGQGVEAEAQRIPEDDEVPAETALFAVFRSAPANAYALKDFDSARAAIRKAPRKEIEGADLHDLARRILDAARQLRSEGKPTTVEGILWRTAVGRSLREAEVEAEINRAEKAEVDASLRAKGYEPGQGRASLEAKRDAMLAKKAKREG